MEPIQQFKLGIQTIFPALSTIESQFINFPQLLHDFLLQLDVIFLTFICFNNFNSNIKKIVLAYFS